MTGKHTDFESRLLAHRDKVERYVATMVADPEAAADLAQETIRRALAGRGTLRDLERLGAWVYTIAVNLCRAHLRRAVQSERSLEFDPSGLRGTVLSSIVRRESAAALAIAIDRLPILLREAFVLHVIEGLPYAEIARITASSVEALHVRAHRAKGLLRKQLGSAVDTFWSEGT
jgi:RNA polymerase sigma-70 factor (ECF subfamily)